MITYTATKTLIAPAFIDLLNRSTLGERRPVTDLARIQMMLDKADILATAWDADKLVGVSRALSDFSFCTYLSDLAVDEAYQHQGIGKRLVELTHITAGQHTSLVLLAAPKAVDYYPKIGMERHEACYVIRP